MEHSAGLNLPMSKSHVEELVNLWEGILDDVSRKFPTLEGELERDLSRIQRIVAARGIRVFLEDLVQIGKHFDRCLSCGQYSLSGLPLTKRYSNRVVIPKFLRGLYLLVFHDSGQLKEACNVEAIRSIRQLTLAFKKGKLSCTAKANEKEVVEFFAVDSALPMPEGYWSSGEESHRSERCPRSEHGALRAPSSAGSVSTSCHEVITDFSTRCGEDRPRSQGSGKETSEASRDASEAPRQGLTGTPQGETCAETLGARGLIYEGFSRSVLYQGRLSSVDPRKRNDLSRFLAALDFVSGVVTATLGPYDPSVWRFRHGSGAVSEYRGPTNKYYWTNWPDTLESEFPIADYGFHSYSSWADRVRAKRVPSSEELCSRMACVPKTYSKPRLIAMEPSAKMWCQENIWHYFCDRTQDTWIGGFVRFRDQTHNQNLCKVGSRDGTLATVDLSAASDRVTCHAVGQMFRKNPRLLNCLRASRTQRVKQTITKSVPSEIQLRKFSTMGNACTFPVESLIFLSIALASALTKRRLRLTMGSIKSLLDQVAVFGDDLIIPSDCRELLFEGLEILDFKVNAAKSYWTGKFRESCGVDAYDGEDVTPAYWRTFDSGGPESLASTVAVHNNFYKKGYYRTADRLASTIPRVIPTVHTDSGVFGIKSQFGPILDGFPTRYNKRLQRTEVRIVTKLEVTARTPTNDDSALLQYFTEEPAPDTNWRHGVQQRPRTLIRSRWVALSDFYTPCVESK